MYLIVRKGSFILQNASSTVKHALVGPFWSSLHPLTKFRELTQINNLLSCIHHFDDIKRLAYQHLKGHAQRTAAVIVIGSRFT